MPNSQATAILQSDAAQSRAQPSAVGSHSQPAAQQNAASAAVARQQPQQIPEAQAKASSSGRDPAYTKEPAAQQASAAGQQGAQHKPQPQPARATEQPSAAAAKPGGAWGSNKSFRDIAAGNKPDKVGLKQPNNPSLAATPGLTVFCMPCCLAASFTSGLPLLQLSMRWY